MTTKDTLAIAIPILILVVTYFVVNHMINKKIDGRSDTLNERIL